MKVMSAAAHAMTVSGPDPQRSQEPIGRDEQRKNDEQEDEQRADGPQQVTRVLAQCVQTRPRAIEIQIAASASAGSSEGHVPWQQRQPHAREPAVEELRVRNR